MKKIIAFVLAFTMAISSFGAQAKTSTWTKIAIGGAIAAGAYMLGRAKEPEQAQPPAQTPQQPSAPAGQPQQLPTPPTGYGYFQVVNPACNCLVWELHKLK